MNRKLMMVGVLMCASLAALIAWNLRSKRLEVGAIIQRYQAFQSALATGDEASIEAFVAPAYRDSEGKRLGWIRDHANLSKDWDVDMLGNQAMVIPNRTYHHFYFIPIPGGNGVEMIKVDGEWYFTGEISID